jgi:hypothetical protein
MIDIIVEVEAMMRSGLYVPKSVVEKMVKCIAELRNENAALYADIASWQKEEEAWNTEMDAMRKELDALKAASAWVKVTPETTPPLKPGYYHSESYWVAAWEFGQSPVFAVAYCHWSMGARWYLDERFYNLDCPHQIAQEVRYFMPLPALPESETK